MILQEMLQLISQTPHFLTSILSSHFYEIIYKTINVKHPFYKQNVTTKLQSFEYAEISHCVFHQKSLHIRVVQNLVRFITSIKIVI